MFKVYIKRIPLNYPWLLKQKVAGVQATDVGLRAGAGESAQEEENNRPQTEDWL